MIIGDFNSLPGLTRLETLEREAIRYTLVRFPGKRKAALFALKKAAAWLGISTRTIYGKLKYYRKVGCPIEKKINPNISTARASYKSHTNLRGIIGFFGVQVPPKKKFWEMPDYELKEILGLVRSARNTMILAKHPDVGGNLEESIKINENWARIEKLFKKRNIVL